MDNDRKRLLIELFVFLLVFGALLGILISRLRAGGTSAQESAQDLQKRWVAEADRDGIIGWEIQGTDGDRDEDGLPDSEDILAAAKEYVATKPSYESRYYESGYPEDGYGVCTDVVAFSFLRAGFDLRTLVARDIRENPDAYDVPEPDPKIDFRRVVNLQVYFTRHADSLTTDPSETEEWQPGDVVVFENHIGIISDRRSSGGRPYVIHHASPAQGSYEEDILTKREILGHYRI